MPDRAGVSYVLPRKGIGRPFAMLYAPIVHSCSRVLTRKTIAQVRWDPVQQRCLMRERGVYQIGGSDRDVVLAPQPRFWRRRPTKAELQHRANAALHDCQARKQKRGP
jgi:hypothetical protein